MKKRSTPVVTGGFFAALVFLFALVFSGTKAATPQSAAPQPQNPRPGLPPPLRSTTRLVHVSVVVHDKHGQPIAGLKKEDFVILDNKEPQAIQFFSVQSNLPPANPPAPLPPDTYTNRIQQRAGVPTSVTVILLDGLNTEFTDQAYGVKQVVKFLQQIQPQDRVAIYSLGHDLRIFHDFTSDSTSLIAALKAYQGRKTSQLEASTPQVSDNPNPAIKAFLDNAYLGEAIYFVEDRVHRTVDALTQIANHLGTLPGRKNLIWVSGSFPFSIGYDNLEMVRTDHKVIFANDIETAARALTNANIAVYPVDARGLVTFDLGNRSNVPALPSSPMNQGFAGPDPQNFFTMNTLADRTGGKAYYNTNDIFGSIRDAIGDSRVTYELAYYPQGINWNGEFRNIKVEVKAPGAKVRARKGYFALPEPNLTPQIRQAIIAQTATSPLEATGIGIIVRVRKDPAADAPALHAVLAFDPHEFNFVHTDGRWAADIDTVFIQLDDKNQVINALDETFHLKLQPETYQRLLREGITYTKVVPILPAAVEMRVILRDASNGNIGDVEVPLARYFPAKPLSGN